MIDVIATVQLFGTRNNWEAWAKYIQNDSFPEEISTIIQDIGVYYKSRPALANIYWPAFSVWYKRTAHPKLDVPKTMFFDMFIKNVLNTPTKFVAEELVLSWLNEQYVGDVMDACHKTHLGVLKKPLESVVKGLTEDYQRQCGTVATGTSLISMHPDVFTGTTCTSQGYEWRIEDLNRGIGPLRPGDFVLIGGRPEVGKTSFVISEATHMLSRQIKGRILMLNNEEMDWRIMLRFLTVLLNIDSKTVMADIPAAIQVAASLGWNKDRIVIYPAHAASMSAINKVIEEVSPAILIVNRLDKMPVRQTRDSNEASRFSQIGQWARTVAAERPCVVMGVIQAGEAAAGHLVVHEHQLFNTKTALQGETDAIILIGASNQHSNNRGLNVPRNKLLGGPRSVESLRHGFFEVAFNHITGRYKSIAYKRP